ncbi:MAG: YeeE/YedE family protein [Flavobacteriaceae bacterium]|nr:YeeE/YedE family protein [Flavobacteriaceae bacterium]
MKLLKFFLVGIFFGIVLSKSEAISWYRIFEMFKFQSFHMYGIIGSAVVIGIIVIQVIKKTNLKTIQGDNIAFKSKSSGKYRNILGGIIFGLGWALAGACPGPMYVLAGQGIVAILIVLFGAMLGAFLYHVVKGKLPH